MAKQIYCMNLQHHMGVAESAEELFEELNTLYYEGLKREDVDIRLAVSEEATKKMLLLHRVMYKSSSTRTSSTLSSRSSLVKIGTNERKLQMPCA